MHQIEFKKSVEKDLKKIEKRDRNKIFSKIETLAVNPYKQDIKKLINVESYFRIRCGDYRIVFQILDSEEIVIIHHIRHRKDVYRNLL